MSQERLAQHAEISPRHLSCLETGRAAPSRTMVLVLGSALDLPLRERNALLDAAGFAAAYRDEPLDAPEASALRRAVDLVMTAVEPNGAVAVDRAWNVLRMNRAAARLLALFVDMASAPSEVLGNSWRRCTRQDCVRGSETSTRSRRSRSIARDARLRAFRTTRRSRG
jgi:hypothetical protein